MNNKYLNLAIVLLGLMAAPLTQATELSAEDYDLYPGDFNGDGKTDLLYVAKDPAKLSGIAASDGNGPNIVWQTWVSNYLNIDWSRNQYIPLVADFNGDGKADIFLQKATAGDHYLLLSDSRGYVVGISQTLSNTAFGSNLALSADQHKLIAADFSGAGSGSNADLFLQATTPSGTHGLAYSNSNGQFTWGVSQSWTNSMNSPGGFKWSTQDANVFAGDFNGDGRADLLLQAKPKWVMIDYDVTFPVPTYPNGMNGIAYSNGSTTSFGASYKLWNRNDYGIDWSPLTHNLIVAKFDSDDLADVFFQPKNSADTAYLLLRNPTNVYEFLSSPSTLSLPSIGGGNTRLIAGKFMPSGSTQFWNGPTGLYYQALTAGGTNYVSGAAGSAATAHSYSSIATNFLVPSLPPGQATAPGRTRGMFSVSETGTPKYEIPIWVPPGVRGVQPNLAFTFSQGEVGYLGTNAVLSGMTYVARCSKTMVQDGVAESPYRFYADAYCLMPGNSRLRHVSGEYGRDGSTYRLEVDDGSLITMHGSIERPNGGYTVFGGPEWISKQTRDGLIYEYGNTDNSRIRPHFDPDGVPGSWYLNKLRDRNGNSYSVTYAPVMISSGGGPDFVIDTVPVKIEFSNLSPESGSYRYAINLLYERERPFVTYTNQIGTASGNIDSTQLVRIAVTNGSKTLRQYSLTYDMNGGGLKRLTQIQECADDSDSNCYLPTILTHFGEPYQPGNWYWPAMEYRSDLLTSVTDGFGASINIVYEQLANGVVGQYTASDGIGDAYTTTYSYGNAALGSDGRGQLVFDTISTIDSRDGLVRKVTYANEQSPGWAFPLRGKAIQTDVFQSDGVTPISTSTYTPAAVTLDSTEHNQRYMTYIPSQTTNKYEVAGSRNGQWISSEVITRNPPDSYGNPGSMSVAITDKDTASPYYGQTWTTVTTATFGTSPTAVASWCTGLPLSTTVTKFAPGATSLSREITYSNDYAKCRPTQTVIEPTKPTYTVTQNYAFDVFGNITSTTTTGAGVTGSRVTALNWGSTGQFPVSVTNALNQTTTYGYDYDHGVRTRVTDPNGLSTYTSYDGFQRKLSELYADGTGSSWSYTDCRATNSCINGNQRLQVYQRALGVGAVTISDGYQVLDQFDRSLMSRTKLLDGSYSQTETRYNARGLIEKQSAPCTASNCAEYWVTAAYDAIGRLTSTSRPISSTNSNTQISKVAYEGRKTTITDPQDKQSIQYTTVAGTMGRTQDHNGYYQDFTYDAFGSLVKVEDSQAVTWFTATYDYGVEAFQRTISDADLGARAFDYNALGEVTHSSDAKSQHFYFEYDPLSRLTKRTEPDAETTFGYGSNPAARNVGSPQFAQTVANSLTYREDYGYDAVGRVANKSLTVPGASTTAMVYDYSYSPTTGQLDTLTYPASTAGYRLKLQYGYQNGVMSQVSDYNAGTVYWRANAMNARGQLTNETLGNGVIINQVFDPVTGWLKQVTAGPSSNSTSVQNASYLQDLVGNVTQRQNNSLGLTENFTYDDVYRLKTSAVGAQTVTYSYQPNGNINSRTDMGAGAIWTYDATKKHAVLNAAGNTYAYDANGNAYTRNGNAITWTSYNYPKQINNIGGESISFSYGPDRQRWKTSYTSATGATPEVTYKIGGLLEQVVTGTTTDYRHFISGGSSHVAIYSRKSDGTNALRYTLEDHKGSVDKILSDTGSVQYSESFTAFGARRNAATWSGAAPTTELNATYAITRQGYTGHDMLGNMGLIHMNGRVQDSVTGRFLSADPYVSEPGNTQNYNRYSYVYNNPMSYTDPSGFYSMDWSSSGPPCYICSDPMATIYTGFGVWSGGQGWNPGSIGAQFNLNIDGSYQTFRLNTGSAFDTGEMMRGEYFNGTTQYSWAGPQTGMLAEVSSRSLTGSFSLSGAGFANLLGSSISLANGMPSVPGGMPQTPKPPCTGIAGEIQDLTGGDSNQSFVDDVVNNFVDVKDNAGSTVLETGLSIAGGGTAAKAYGGLTAGALALQAWKDYRSPFAMTGIGFRSFGSAFATAGATWAVNTVLIKGAYNAGVLTGSILRTGINRAASATCNRGQ